MQQPVRSGFGQYSQRQKAAGGTVHRAIPTVHAGFEFDCLVCEVGRFIARELLPCGGTSNYGSDGLRHCEAQG